MTATGEEIVVGRITGAYGIKGWVKVFSYTDPIEGILQYSPWILTRGRKRERLAVEAGMRQGKGLIALPQGFTERSQAERLAGFDISVDKAALPPLDEGEWYWHQLEGLTVVNLAGEHLGTVDHLMETGANDVLVVEGDGVQRLIPFVEDTVVKEVDMAAGRLTVDWETDW